MIVKAVILIQPMAPWGVKGTDPSLADCKARSAESSVLDVDVPDRATILGLPANVPAMYEEGSHPRSGIIGIMLCWRSLRSALIASRWMPECPLRKDLHRIRIAPRTHASGIQSSAAL